MSKYHNVPVEAYGIRFDSLAELRRYEQLRLLQLSGKITDLVVHPTYELLPACTINGKRERPIRYVADFQYDEDGHTVVEDVKGGKATQTREWKLKWRMARMRYPDITFHVVEEV